MSNSTDSIVNHLQVNTSSILDQPGLDTLNQAFSLTPKYLHDFADSPEFAQKIAVAFGEGIDVDLFLETWLAGNFSVFPQLGIVSNLEINGANGAFAKATSTIYLFQEYLAANVSNSNAI